MLKVKETNQIYHDPDTFSIIPKKNSNQEHWILR